VIFTLFSPVILTFDLLAQSIGSHCVVKVNHSATFCGPSLVGFWLSSYWANTQYSNPLTNKYTGDTSRLSMPCLTFCAWGTRIALGRMHTFALVMICIISQCCIWSTWFPVVNHSWVRSIVGRTLFSTCELFLFCAKLLVEQVTISCLIHLLMVNQHGQLSFPSLRGWLLSSNPCYSGQTAEGILRGVAYHQCQWVLLAARL